MAKDNLKFSNANGVTNDDSTTCGLNDMNCTGDTSASTSHSLNNMNAKSNNEDTTCSITDMNCNGDS